MEIGNCVNSVDLKLCVTSNIAIGLPITFTKDIHNE